MRRATGTAAAGRDSNCPEGNLELLPMWVERESLVVGVSVLVQVLGMIGVIVARLSQRRGASWGSAGIAVVCLVLVGCLSMGTMETCERGWLIFATTLPLMAVGATIDTRKTATRTAF